MWRICALDSETCDATEPSANNAGIQCVVGIGQAKGGNFQPTDVDLYLSGWLCVRVVNSFLLATNTVYYAHTHMCTVRVLCMCVCVLMAVSHTSCRARGDLWAVESWEWAYKKKGRNKSTQDPGSD